MVGVREVADLGLMGMTMMTLEGFNGVREDKGSVLPARQVGSCAVPPGAHLLGIRTPMRHI